MSKTSKLIARFAVCAALVAVAFILDMVMYSLLPLLPQMTLIISVLVVMSLCQLFDYKTAVFCTAVMGITSLIIAAFTAPLFVNPLISVFPRILIGLGCYPVFKAMSKVFEKTSNFFLRNILPRSIGAATGVLINTLTVLPMMWFFMEAGAFAAMLEITILFNALIELGLALIFVPLISYPVSKRITKLNAESLDETVFIEEDPKEG